MAIALVTGTSTGIGYTTALHLARNGYKTYATMRNLEKSGPLLDEAARENLPLESLALDVTDDDSMTKGVASILEKESQIDVLVNNAGIGGGAPLEFLDPSELREIMETNFFGATRMMQLVIPGMRQRNTGTIVNITSVAGVFANPIQTPYCASKFALEALSECVAAEVARFNVRIANIEPGCVVTPIFEKGEGLDDLPSDFPYLDAISRLMRVFEQGLKEPAYPQDVADVVLHAIQTDQPKLRYLVGKDAHQVMDAHARMTDEEKLALMGESDNDTFWRKAGEMMPYLR